MILVIGGIASGKHTYVRSRGYDEVDFSGDPSSSAPVVEGLDELLRGGPLDDRSRMQVLAKEVVICCEVGSGVVPIDAGERAWRERVGRTCGELAASATEVVRMVCGIPVTLYPERERC